jgi:hypothetical protein
MKWRATVHKNSLLDDVTVHALGQRCGKGDRHLLCEAPEGPFRPKVPVTFSAVNGYSMIRSACYN